MTDVLAPELVTTNGHGPAVEELLAPVQQAGGYGYGDPGMTYGGASNYQGDVLAAPYQWALITGPKGATGPAWLVPATDSLFNPAATPWPPVRKYATSVGAPNTPPTNPGPNGYSGFGLQYAGGTGYYNYGGIGTDSNRHIQLRAERDTQGRVLLQGLLSVADGPNQTVFDLAWDMIPVGNRMVCICMINNASNRSDILQQGSGGDASYMMQWAGGTSYSNGSYWQFNAVYQTAMPLSWVDYGCQVDAYQVSAGLVSYTISPGQVSSYNVRGRPMTMKIPRTTVQIPYTNPSGYLGPYWFMYYDMATQQFAHDVRPVWRPIDPGGGDYVSILWDQSWWMQRAARGQVVLCIWSAGSGSFDPTQFYDRRFLIRGSRDTVG
jgi:hypothetical protein